MKQIVYILVLLTILGSGIYLYQRSAQKPLGNDSVAPVTKTTQTGYAAMNQIPLTIAQPRENETVINSNITVSGQTVSEADVSVNDADIKADANGNFSVQIQLDEGENIISVIASDQDGNYSEKELSVNLQQEE